MPTITIGFVPRERFVLAAESLASLYEHTTLPFELLVVDPATPERYLAEMRAVLDRRDGWRILHADRHLLPAASRNLVLSEAAGDFVCLLENDNLFNPGWLEGLLAACERYPADVASPLIREGRGSEGHFDRHLGSVVASSRSPGRREVLPLSRPRDVAADVEEVQFVEQHCLLFRRAVFDRIGAFDEELNTRDEVDLSLALLDAGATVVVTPRSVVNYVPPTTALELEELDFYRLRWDLDRAAASRERIAEKWDLVETPGDLDFVRYRNNIPRLSEVRDRLEHLCRGGRAVVLLDDGDWLDTEVTEGLRLRPFPDVGGHFGGFPADEGAALGELERALAQGPAHVVVGWPARWWFDHLPELERSLHTWAASVERTDLMDVFSGTGEGR